MPRFIVQGKKTVDAFLNSRDARETLRGMGRAEPEESPALQPLRTAARAFSGRLDSLAGMPERPYDVVEREAIEAAQQLQNALNELSSQQPELYRQHAEAFERAWQELGLEIEGAAPQVQAQQAPKAEAVPKVDFFTMAPGAFARYMTRALKNNSPELKAFDELAGRLNNSKEKDKLRTAQFNVTELRKGLKGLVSTVDSPEEVAGDYLVAGTQVVKLRKAMAELQKSDPKLFSQVFGPFVQAMEGLDFSKEQTEFTELQKIHKAALAEEEARDKQAKEEAFSRKVTLYGNVEVTENCGIHFTEKMRNDIVDDPGFKKTPPSIDPLKLAKLIWVAGNTLDFGPENPLDPEYSDAIETQGEQLWNSSSAYFERLAKEPEVARLLSQREEGKTWYATSQVKLTRYMEDVFDARYEPNRASEETRKAAAAALAEAYDTFREYGAPLQDAGNTQIGVFYYRLKSVQDTDGGSAIKINLMLTDAGRAFLDSITEPGMEQTEESKECLKATLKAMHALAPADEFAQVCEDMNQRLGIANDPANLDYITPEMFDPKDLKSGLKLIDDLKKGLKTDESARDAAAKIMAARILTDTKGGKASYLDIPISQTRVEQVAEALKGSESFNQWLGGLDKNKAAKLLSGHGGDLEKSFKDHLKKLPAGELRNDPVLRRYMPTAKERIEELQKQAATVGKERELLRTKYNELVDVLNEKKTEIKEQMAEKGWTEDQVDMEGLLEQEREAAKTAQIPLDKATRKCAAATAEIIAIRNACRVERGGAGLGRQIPPARGASNIANTVSHMVGDDDTRDLLTKKAVQNALMKGHGGQMMVDIRTLSKDEYISHKSAVALFENTVESRKNALRKEAERLYLRLDEGSSEALLKQTRRVLGEYAALVITPSFRDKPEQDMKWQAMDKMAAKAETDPLFVAMTADRDHAQAAMDWIEALNEGEFRQKFTERTNIIQGKQTEKVSAPKEAEKEAEKEVEKRTEEPEYSFEDPDASYDLF